MFYKEYVPQTYINLTLSVTLSIYVNSFNALQVKTFLEKNKDTLRSDIIDLLCESKDVVSTF